MLEQNTLKPLLEAILLAADKPMTEEQLLAIFLEEEKPALGVLRQALQDLQTEFTDRGIELVQVASGYRFQIKTEWAPWVSRLWEEKPQRYSRALLETLALIAYRQPITRGEIEDIRGVTVSTSIIKTLLEDREWVRVVGHREVPGRPALYATTKVFLDYFGLKNLTDLPALPDILSLGVDPALDMLKPEGEDVETLHVSMPALEPLRDIDAILEQEDPEIELEEVDVEETIDISDMDLLEELSDINEEFIEDYVEQAYPEIIAEKSEEETNAEI